MHVSVTRVQSSFTLHVHIDLLYLPLSHTATFKISFLFVTLNITGKNKTGKFILVLYILVPRKMNDLTLGKKYFGFFFFGEQETESDKSSMLVSLCYALSLLGRRALGAASNNSSRLFSVE